MHVAANDTEIAAHLDLPLSYGHHIPYTLTTGSPLGAVVYNSIGNTVNLNSWSTADDGTFGVISDSTMMLMVRSRRGVSTAVVAEYSTNLG